MPWLGMPGAQAQDTNALDSRFRQLERRIIKLETRANLPANVSSDFVAREGETLIIDAPLAGIAGLLPAPTSQNRAAVIHLVFRTNGPVSLRCVGGTINSQDTLLRARVGAYTAVCDGTTGWWIESLALPRARDLCIQDYFASGLLVSGSIGQLGWTMLGAGTPAVTRGSVALNSASKLVITTSAAANDRTTICLGTTETASVVDPQEFTVLQCAWNFNNILTNKRVFFGLSSSFTSAPASAADAIGVLYDSSVGANYLINVRAGSAGSVVDSGIAAPANTSEMITIWQVTPGVYRFYAATRLLGTVTGNTLIPNVPLNCGYRLETLTTTLKTHRTGYFGLECRGLTSAMDDDDVLRS